MDLTSIIFGMMLGATLTITFIFILLYLSNKRFVKQCMTAKPIEDEVIRRIIKDKQKQIMTSTKLGIAKNYDLTQELVKQTIQEIAVYYYPESKYPELEINLYEALDLTEKVSARIKGMLDHKVTSPIKKLRLSQIMTILEIKKNVENNKVYQFSKKYKLEKLFKFGYTAINATNPFYWVRKLIFTSTLESTLRGIGVTSIRVVGEESASLYSKNRFDPHGQAITDELGLLVQEIQTTEMEVV